MARKSDIRYIQYHYTDGSAARQLEPKIIRHNFATKVFKPMFQKERAVKVDPLAVCGIVVSVIMLVLMLAGVMKLRAVQDEIVYMQAYVQTLEEENTILQNQYDSKLNLEEVEKTALALGMIPREEAQQITIRVQLPVEDSTPSFWENIGTFLTGFFA